MKVTCITCPKCRHTIYSRALHDMRFCSCGQFSIDGGRHYYKITGPYFVEASEIDIPYTQQELYDDWNNGKDKLGLIAP